MIEFYTGVPGSGKTYLAVKTLAEKYYDYKKDLQEWIAKKEKNIQIITNINNLQLPGILNLDSIFREHKLNFNLFFAKAYQDKIHEKYPNIVYVLDEVQQYLPPNFKDTEVVLYFDTHRHYGDHIIMITQSLQKVSKMITPLQELETRALKKTFSFTGHFRYAVKSSGEIISKSYAYPDKKIFALYTSFIGNDQKVKKTNLFYYLIGLSLLAIVGTYFFFNNMLSFHKTSEPIELTETKTKLPEKKIEIKDKNGEPVYYDQIISVQILSFVASANDELLSYQDPITGNIYTPKTSPYNILYSKPYYHILLPESKYNRLAGKVSDMKPFSGTPPQHTITTGTKIN